jgi:GTP:adenosylcobinamide-phosphate guanylyltransferase
MKIPAVIAAGDRGAAKAVYGESKPYLEIAGRSLVAHAVILLQGVPEVSEVYVVGDAERLARALGGEALRRELRKPLHIVPQRGNLYENAWQAYRRALPGAGPDGRDPVSEEDLDQRVLYLPADMPFATPEEVSRFVRGGLARDCDYALGLVTEESMAAFYPRAPGDPGIHMAYFNLREGRFRQSNLHLVRPARLGNRHYIEDMYRNRYQRELRPILVLAWQLLTSQRGGVAIVFYYALMHLAGFADRHGLARLADGLRRLVPLERVARGCGDLLDTRFAFVVTDVGGCAVDVDNEHDFEVARERYDEWTRMQHARALASGAPPAPPALGTARR